MKVLLLQVADFFKQLIFRLFLLMIILTAIAYYFYFYKPSDTGVITGKIRDFRLNEISGLVVSEKNADTLWVHNDSGHDNIIYAISKRGNIREKFEINGIDLRDIEDISIYKDDQGESYLILSDLGSNTKMRTNSTPKLVFFKEPDLLVDLCELPSENSGQTYQISQFEIYELEFPDVPEIQYTDQNAFINNIINNIENATPDIEAIIVDTKQKELLFFSKTYKGITGIFSIPLDNLKSDGINKLSYEGSINIKQFTEGYHIDFRHLLLSPINFPYAVTAADLSRDQDTLLIRTYGNTWEWHRGYAQKSFSQIIQTTKPEYVMSAFEPLGESIGIDLDSKGFYTISEGLFSKIYYNELP
ncbi:hypothetical protein [Fusibacter ferrireducens]|uniref:DUF4340 domain-containing protein n=1 Tax=Fusibacter ferrireducens TaxID=2785058 RepID=A0ABR9ZN25_9FIRM|nr:hypothetical protein [Fusibacter ferrireducens]MBF4691870.1 hypothetical protein [Fusibacter ferrireducens]